MTNLRSINFGMNQYCGPAVLSALTGKSTDECAAVISQINGQQEIRAVHYSHIMLALKKLRFNAIEMQSPMRTLYGTLMSLAKQEGMYLVGVPKHVVAVEVKDGKIYLIDNHTKQPIDASASARLIQTVDKLIKVEPRPEPKLICKEIRIVKTSKYIKISEEEVYDVSEENRSINLGTIYYNSYEQLQEILRHLRMFDDEVPV